MAVEGNGAWPSRRYESLELSGPWHLEYPPFVPALGAIESIETSIRFGSVTHGLRSSLAWFLAAVPLGFSLMIYRLAQSIWRDLDGLRQGRPVFEGEKMFDEG